jgi:hypothetical protein
MTQFNPHNLTKGCRHCQSHPTGGRLLDASNITKKKTNHASAQHDTMFSGLRRVNKRITRMFLGIPFTYIIT